MKDIYKRINELKRGCCFRCYFYDLDNKYCKKASICFDALSDALAKQVVDSCKYTPCREVDSSLSAYVGMYDDELGMYISPDSTNEKKIVLEIDKNLPKYEFTLDEDDIYYLNGYTKFIIVNPEKCSMKFKGPNKICIGYWSSGGYIIVKPTAISKIIKQIGIIPLCFIQYLDMGHTLQCIEKDILESNKDLLESERLRYYITDKNEAINLNIESDNF